MDGFEEKRALFLRAVHEAVDRLTDTDPEELDRVWLDEDLETFRELLRARVRAALKKEAA